MATIVIIGRKNVGKSTVFNRLTGHRLSVVYNEPGVTRDRIYGEVTWRGGTYDLLDTGGFYPDESDNLTVQINRQIKYGIEEADIILFVVDGRTGLHPIDQDIAKLLHKSGKKILLLVNKIDQHRDALKINEFMTLGFPEIYAVSAEGGLGFGEVLEAINTYLPKIKIRKKEKKINIVILGRPNAGKSTLLNTIVKKERAIVDERPGTTRDLVITEFAHNGKNIRIIDTCGLRKLSRVKASIEFYSVVRSLRAINAADIAILLFDVKEGVVDQDRRIASLVMSKTKGLIFAPNKIDLLDKKNLSRVYSATIKSFNGFEFVPVVPISALARTGIDTLLRQVIFVYGEMQKYADRHVLQEMTKKLQPPVTGALLRINQVAIRPPIFKVRLTRSVDSPYIKYVRHALRNYFGYAGVPILIRTEKIAPQKPSRQYRK